MNFVYFLGWCFFRSIYATYFRCRVILTPEASAKGRALGFRIVTVTLSSNPSASVAINEARDSSDSYDVFDTF